MAEKKNEQTTKTSKITTAKPTPVPTASEAEMLQQFQERRKSLRPGRVIVKPGNKVGFDHESNKVGEIQLMEALGVADYDFIDGLLEQLANAGSVGPEISERHMNFMLSVIKSIEPSDQMEVMLGAQMAATHMACMTFTRKLAHVETIRQQDSAERTLNRLLRTFASQMEALRKYRTGGEQRVIVQHVHVNEGGQAVVGNVNNHSQAKSD